MRHLNKVMLHGNLTSDPEVKPTKNGTNLTTFSLATNRDWKNREGKVVSSTDFHRIVAFGKYGELMGKYFKKGMPVIISGRLSNRSFVGGDGKRRYLTEVVAEDFHFLSRRKLEAKIAAVHAETGEVMSEAGVV